MFDSSDKKGGGQHRDHRAEPEAVDARQRENLDS